MLVEKSTPGKLHKMDIVCSFSETNALVFYIVAKDTVLHHVDVPIPVKTLNNEELVLRSCSLLEEKGHIMVVPPNLYEIHEGTVKFSSVVSRCLDEIIQDKEDERGATTRMDDEDWAVLLDD